MAAIRVKPLRWERDDEFSRWFAFAGKLEVGVVHDSKGLGGRALGFGDLAGPHRQYRYASTATAKAAIERAWAKWVLSLVEEA